MEQAKDRSIFQNLRDSRSLLMGLAIIGIAFYHVPVSLHVPWLELGKSLLNWGVDLFLFLSGLGACHSIKSSGGGAYLKKRARRLLPGLYLILLPWCAAMMLLGAMDIRQLLGSITLLGWWLGDPVQLNWYFSAVWLFFLLAVLCYPLFARTRRPVLLWLGLTAAGIAVGVLCPLPRLMTAAARLPVFFTGMLFGCLEQRGFRQDRYLRLILFPLMLLGLWLAAAAYLGWGDVYGYSLGLWWYPYALVIPGGAVLISDLAAALGKFSLPVRLGRIIRRCGECSAEILMVHMAIYKLILAAARLRGRYWLLVFPACLALGCGYHRLVERLFFKKKDGDMP